jgi:hypothetical protein
LLIDNGVSIRLSERGIEVADSVAAEFLLSDRDANRVA